MRLSELRDEEALDALAELIDPVFEILGDPEIAAIERQGKPRSEMIKIALKKHKKAIIQILAATERVPVEEYHVDILTLPKKLIETLNDPDIQSLFSSQSQMTTGKSSGSATENIKAEGK